MRKRYYSRAHGDPPSTHPVQQHHEPQLLCAITVQRCSDSLDTRERKNYGVTESEPSTRQLHLAVKRDFAGGTMPRHAAQDATRRDAPPPRHIALLRYLWPFWLFRDVSRGDLYARAAAYRHNRTMRVYLPAYLKRWSIGSVATLGIAVQLAALSSPGTPKPDAFLVMAAAGGMLFAIELCFLLTTAYIYLYLSHHNDWN